MIEEQLDALGRLETVVLRGIAQYQRTSELVPAVDAGAETLGALAGYLLLLSQQRQVLLAAYAEQLLPATDPEPPAS